MKKYRRTVKCLDEKWEAEVPSRRTKGVHTEEMKTWILAMAVVTDTADGI